MKKKSMIFKGLVISLVLMAVTFYVWLPPLNPTSLVFWFWLWFTTIPLTLCVLVENISDFISLKVKGTTVNNPTKLKKTKFSKFYGGLLAGSMVVVAVLYLFNTPFLHADEYANRIVFKDVDFDTVNEVDFNKTAIIDRASTLVLGNRTLGQLPELISQFDVSEIYSQIAYQDTIIRVTPLDYNGIIKYFTNKSEGIPAYITVSAISGKSELVKLSDLGLDNMKYSVNAMFSKDRDRHLRFGYPFDIFGETNFEIDEQGVPYWVTPTLKFKGVNQKPMVEGVVVMNAIDGSMEKYLVGSIPEWVDRVYPTDLILTEVNQSGLYVHGIINSFFGQKDVYQASDGYNYIELDEDIWVYTGITSATSDQSNIGFVLINQRTHEARKIMSAGAEEYSAMRSAEGKVQNLGYTSTFPLLINVAGRPTYLVSLKDSAGLVKMYAMIDCEDYQQVITVNKEEGLEALKSQYIASMNLVDNGSMETKVIEIVEVNDVMIDGNTYVYFKDKNDMVYRCQVIVNEKILPFLKAGDRVEITYSKGEINLIYEIEMK